MKLMTAMLIAAMLLPSGAAMAKPASYFEAPHTDEKNPIVIERNCTVITNMKAKTMRFYCKVEEGFTVTQQVKPIAPLRAINVSGDADGMGTRCYIAMPGWGLADCEPDFPAPLKQWK